MGGHAGYRLDVQGLRGISVLLVVLYHAGLAVPGGFIGVDVFFVISGFVIGQNLLGEGARTGRIDLREFYVRRVRRLLPALAVMVGVVTVASAFVLSPAFPQRYAFGTGLAASFSAANLFLWLRGGGYFSPLDEQNPFVHTWSLGVEEQFYLVFPLAVALAWRVGRRSGQARTVLASGFIAVSVVSFALSVMLTYEIGPLASIIPDASRFAFYGPVTRVWEFAVGGLLAIWLTGERAPRPSALAGIAGLAIIGAISLGLFVDVPFPGFIVVLPVLGAALILVSRGGPSLRLTEHPVLVWMGDRSYSWYLWHWPLIVLLPLALPELPFAKVVAAVLSLAPAMASYRFVEQRFRVRGPAPSQVRILPVAMASILIPALLLGFALQGAQRWWGLEQRSELATQSPSQAQDCYEFSTPIEDCTFGDGTAGTVVLVGDSHADAVAGAVIQAAEEEGHRVVVRSALACPFLTVKLEWMPDGCAARHEESAELIAELQPDLVVIANRSTMAVGRLDGLTSADNLDEVPSDEALATWQSAMEATYNEVSLSTDQVMVLSVVPHFPIEAFDQALPTLLRPDGTFSTSEIEEVAIMRDPVLTAEHRAADGIDTVSFVDPLSSLCSDTECSVRDSGGLFLYRDNNHLTGAGAERLTGLLRQSLFDGAPS